MIHEVWDKKQKIIYLSTYLCKFGHPESKAYSVSLTVHCVLICHALFFIVSLHSASSVKCPIKN